MDMMLGLEMKDELKPVAVNFNREKIKYIFNQLKVKRIVFSLSCTLPLEARKYCDWQA